MDYEKIRTDFQKRYGKSCENIFFTGENVEFFSKNEMSVSACLSIGEALAFSKRSDGKINIQYSGRDDMVSFSVFELLQNSKNELAKLLIRAGVYGIKTDGADIVIFKNTRITNLFRPLVIGGMSGFCRNVPQKGKLVAMFEKPLENIKTLSGRKGCFLISDGQKIVYKPFFGGKYKLVVSCCEEGGHLKNVPKNPSVDESIIAIKKGDACAFASLLDRDTRRFLETQKETQTHRIFWSASRTRDALGSGIAENGWVFSLVENGRIDIFVHNTASIFRKNFGGDLNFYITDFADSGVFLQSDY